MFCHLSHWGNVTLIKGNEDNPHLLSQGAVTDSPNQATRVSQLSEECLLSGSTSPRSHQALGHSRACAQDPEMWVAATLVTESNQVHRGWKAHAQCALLLPSHRPAFSLRLALAAEDGPD